MPGLEDRLSSNGVSTPVNGSVLKHKSNGFRYEFGSNPVPSFVDSEEQYDVSERLDPVTGDGPILIDVMGSEGALQSLRVKPSIFISLLKRLDHPVIAHYKRRFGKHVYFAYRGDFIVETRTRRPLDLDTGPESMEEAKLARGKARSMEEECKGPDGQYVWDGAQKRSPLTEFYTAERCYVTEWWNRREDPALSVARLRVEPGVSTRPYRLRGVSERYLILAGRATIEIDREKREVGPGDCILINAGSWRSITNTGDRDLGLLAISRPRFRRLDPNSPKRQFVGERK